MNHDTTERDGMRLWRDPVVWLVTAGLVTWSLYLAITVLSWRFQPGVAPKSYPILTTLGLFAGAFAAYVVGIWSALRIRAHRRLMLMIVITSVLFRLPMLVSWPILEIDIYRYLWDGAVVTCGVSPYRYSPAQVLDAEPRAELPTDLRVLVNLRDSDPALAVILGRIHFGELPTIYPPVSQAVFAWSAWTTPSGSSVFQRMVLMKVWLVLFDVGTLLIVLGLLRLAGRHPGWALAYGWCPLVIKEIANTGHLDAIAVFLTTLALFFAMQAVQSRYRHPIARTVLAVLFWALGFGAKLYPIVLAPLLFLVLLRHRGWRWATCAAVPGVLLAAILIWPMLPDSAHGVERGQTAPPAGDVPPIPTDADGAAAARPIAQDPSGGLKAFLRHWEINDFLFMIVVENLKPSNERMHAPAWFVVMPRTWRTRLVRRPADRLSVSPPALAFLFARGITLAVFVLLTLILAWRAAATQDVEATLRAALLTLAWFWLLAPTQNPWYWTWVMPLVMFGRCRAWLAVSGMVLIYYLRFWLTNHYSSISFCDATYSGQAFFDYVVVWLEFVPWFIWLTVECTWRTWRMARHVV